MVERFLSGNSPRIFWSPSSGSAVRCNGRRLYIHWALAPLQLGVTATYGWDMRHQWRLKMLMTLYDFKILSGSIDILLHIYMSDSKLLIRSVGSGSMKSRQPKAYEVDVAGTSLSVFSGFVVSLRFFFKSNESLEKMVENPKNPILTPQKWREHFDHKIYTPANVIQVHSPETIGGSPRGSFGHGQKPGSSWNPKSTTLVTHEILGFTPQKSNELIPKIAIFKGSYLFQTSILGIQPLIFRSAVEFCFFLKMVKGENPSLGSFWSPLVNLSIPKEWRVMTT